MRNTALSVFKLAQRVDGASLYTSFTVTHCRLEAALEKKEKKNALRRNFCHLPNMWSACKYFHCVIITFVCPGSGSCDNRACGRCWGSLRGCYLNAADPEHQPGGARKGQWKKKQCAFNLANMAPCFSHTSLCWASCYINTTGNRATCYNLSSVGGSGMKQQTDACKSWEMFFQCSHNALIQSNELEQLQ